MAHSYAHQPVAIQLKDYQVPDFKCDALYLHFELEEHYTHVNAVMHLRRNPDSGSASAPLVLHGENMQLRRVLLDGHQLQESQYAVTDETLTVTSVPEQFVLETEVLINPHENLALSGLYKSRGNYCTQCESQGFRRITYFMDRPDVMTYFTVTISADKQKYPILLSNGNLIEEKDLDRGRHWVKWHDPSLKPSYLFALVAGDLDLLQDSFTTMSGRNIDLRIYVESGNREKSYYAMESLKNAMRWDEQTFGREYDLDIYMIVAVSDFNMGAMENKGLNIFNDKYILAMPDTATDEDYVFIESVIGHEYFHNWSGNRVTVRDWFQITLKEGLTIFRDQSFTADHTLGDVKRIQDVNVLRNVQFPQDAGPMAHSVRPQSYVEINNFYTVTVYNKGSEVIRMQQTLLGKDKFRLAMDEYFRRFDGKAVTTDDFVGVMSEVGRIDLTQFKRWYEQAGTPTLMVTDHYDAAAQKYTLTIQQSTPPTPDQPTKLPFQIPFAVGLLYQNGAEAFETKVLNLTEAQQSFEFADISSKPIPSLLRNFSAPVKVVYPYSDEELFYLMLHDSDGFNRWDAGQRLATGLIMELIQFYQEDKTLISRETFVKAYQQLVADQGLDHHLKAEMLSLPAISYLTELMGVADIDAIYNVREFIKNDLANALATQWQACYQLHALTGSYAFNRYNMGHRRMRNIALGFMMAQSNPARDIAVAHYQQANNLTDRIGALMALNDTESTEREAVLAAFYERYQNDSLVLDKWFRIQAIAPLPGTLAKVKELLAHPAFSLKNPNKVRALIGSFAMANPVCFHAKDGSGYDFLISQVLAIDAFNPQTAARLIEPLISYKKYDKSRSELMKKALEKVQSHGKLSKDVHEIVVKSLIS